MSLPEKIEISEEVLFEDLDGKAVLLNLESEEYYSLDEVGTRMWALLSEENTPEDTLKTILDEYEVEEEKLRNDISNLLNSLKEAELVSF